MGNEKNETFEKIVITNIEKPNLMTDLICLVIYPKQTLSLGQQVCAPGGPAGAHTGSPTGVRTCWASQSGNLNIKFSGWLGGWQEIKLTPKMTASQSLIHTF